jgi:hypothetical protein
MAAVPRLFYGAFNHQTKGNNKKYKIPSFYLMKKDAVKPLLAGPCVIAKGVYSEVSWRK